MIIFSVRLHGPYTVTKCYLPCANCIRHDGIFNQLLLQHSAELRVQFSFWLIWYNNSSGISMILLLALENC